MGHRRVLTARRLTQIPSSVRPRAPKTGFFHAKTLGIRYPSFTSTSGCASSLTPQDAPSLARRDDVPAQMPPGIALSQPQDPIDRRPTMGDLRQPLADESRPALHPHIGQCNGENAGAWPPPLASAAPCRQPPYASSNLIGRISSSAVSHKCLYLCRTGAILEVRALGGGSHEEDVPGGIARRGARAAASSAFAHGGSSGSAARENHSAGC